MFSHHPSYRDTNLIWSLVRFGHHMHDDLLKPCVSKDFHFLIALLSFSGHTDHTANFSWTFSRTFTSVSFEEMIGTTGRHFSCQSLISKPQFLQGHFNRRPPFPFPQVLFLSQDSNNDVIILNTRNFHYFKAFLLL